MQKQVFSRIRSPRRRTSEFSSVSDRAMFESRPFVVQSKVGEEGKKPELTTSFMRAERYGYHLSQIAKERMLGQKEQKNVPHSPVQLAMTPDESRKSEKVDDKKNSDRKYRYLTNEDKDPEGYKLGNQVNYGPTADLNDDAQKQSLRSHYGKPKTEETDNFFDRLNQYSGDHKTYVKAAQETERPLTKQELSARDSNKNAPNASINHIIASGTGQNILNHETLRFNQGRERFQKHNPMPKNLEGESKKQLGLALAEQAAAVGRVQGYSRAIINERHGESFGRYSEDNERIYGSDQVKRATKRKRGEDDGKQPLDAIKTRNQALRHTLTAFQGEQPDQRYRAFKDVQKMTFDSPGNLRVGDDYGNNQVSTGVDVPLNSQGEPTERGNRLLATHEAYAPDRLLTKDRLFSRDSNRKILSSSQTPEDQTSTGITTGEKSTTTSTPDERSTKKNETNNTG